jgi:hypothetical protein
VVAATDEAIKRAARAKLRIFMGSSIPEGGGL